MSGIASVHKSNPFAWGVGRRLSQSAVATAAVFCATAALAADMPAPVVKALPPEVPAWTYIATPYVWLPSINGSTTIKGRTTDVNATIFDLLNRPIPADMFGLMGAFEARRGPFALMTDIAYMKLGASGSAARERSVNRFIGGAVSADVSVKFEMVIAEAVAAYEVVNWRGDAPGTQTAIDLYGGGRLWWQNAESNLALTAGLNIGNLTRSGSRAIAASGDVTWVDPLVGLRLRHHFSPATEVMVRGDVGGFDAGSKFSWQVIGNFNWEFLRTQTAVWSAMLGYRALYVNFEKGGGNTLYQYDMLMHGPIVGVTARF